MQTNPGRFPPYHQYDTDILIAAYRAGPLRLRTALDGLTEVDLKARPRGPATWSIHEIVVHVADSELQGVYRLRKVWSEVGARLPGYDQDAWARAIDYQGGDGRLREEALSLFAALRETAGSLLARATDPDWERWGLHPDWGRVTFRNLLELYADHGERHLEQIVRIRRQLGVAKEIPSLLPDRLY